MSSSLGSEALSPGAETSSRGANAISLGSEAIDSDRVFRDLTGASAATFGGSPVLFCDVRFAISLRSSEKIEPQ
jgi:hypothetical protein